MNSTPQAPDILGYHFLRLKMPAPLAYRFIMLMGMFRGELTIKEFFGLLLPGTMKSQELRLKFHYFFIDYINRTIKRFVNADGSVNLYGRPYYPYFPGNYQELVEHIYQVIVRDQYRSKKFIKDHDVVIDAGANIGTFSRMIANDHPEAHIYAFEPIAETFAVLKKNLGQDSNAHCVSLGLGDVVSKKEMQRYETSGGSSAMVDSGAVRLTEDLGTILRESVSVTTVDTFVAEQKLSKVDFIKIDTEGYEARVLKGARETIQKFKPVIAMSAYHNPNDKEELPKVLKSIYPDYICELHKDSEEDFVCYPASRS